MKHIKFLLVGILFGIVMTKSEVISWYRIYEMFTFQSFHMYGIIGSAIVLGIILTQIIRITAIKSITGKEIKLVSKTKTHLKSLIGGVIFGLGWALTGVCPGPMFVLLGNGFGAILIVIFSALIGTFIYGIFKNKLPH
jgi:uncharacterized membrane protein YedE/YeeE|tara:strand:- start:84 stop:497 length:414 start_codon:yes stop_codon:yes gene_type:complete